MPPLIAGSVVAFVTACVLTDVRTRRIPNGLSVAGAVAGIALHAAYDGPRGIGAGASGFLLAMAVLLPPFALGGIGGGDVKMAAALGALLGARLAVVALGAGLMFGGVVTAAHLARGGRLGRTAVATATMLYAAVATGSLAPLRAAAAAPGAVTLPYSVPLGLGALAAVVAAARGVV